VILALARRSSSDVAWTDARTHEQLMSLVMSYAALPSFVLVDREGTVVATSDDAELGEVGEGLDEIGVEVARECLPQSISPLHRFACTFSWTLNV
jgi:hypothetical protein